MPPHRVTVLRTLAPNSIPLLLLLFPATHPPVSPPSFRARDSPPTFSLALFLARRAVSHSARAAFLDETFPARRDTRRSLTLPYQHRHYYHRWSPLPPSISYTTTTADATTTTISSSSSTDIGTMSSLLPPSTPPRSPSALPHLPVATRRCVAYGASPLNLPLLSRFNPLSLVLSLLSFRFSLLPARAEHTTLSSVYILRVSFSASPSSFT